MSAAQAAQAARATAFRTGVTEMRDLSVEWDKDSNRLRVADSANDKTLAVYSNGGVYMVMPEAPAGQVVISSDDRMPRLVQALEHAKVIRVISTVHDSMTSHTVVTAEVLI